MKKTLAAFAAIVLAVALLLPGLVGGLAFRQHDRQVGMTARTSPAFAVVTESYERGWFRSRVRYRIEAGDTLREAWRQRAGESAADAELPALIVDSLLHHGPFALGTASADGGTWKPVLATAVSDLRLVDGEATVFDVPGQVVTRLGFDGGGTAHYASGPFRVEAPGESMSWTGAEVDVGFDATATHIESAGTLGALTVVDADGRLMTGPLEFTTAQSRTEFGFWSGSSRIDWARAAYTARGQSPTGMRGFKLSSAVRPAGDTVSAEFELAVAALGANGWSAGPLVLHTRTTELDSRALGRLLATLESMQTGAPPDAAQQAAIADDLAGLLAGGPRFALEELRMRTADGEVLATATVKFPETPDASGSGVAVLVQGSSGDLSLRVPASLVAAASAAVPASREYLQVLVDAGLLRIEDGHYTVHAVYGGGLLTVNGIPMPVPLPAT